MCNDVHPGAGYGHLKNDEKNKKGRISGERAIFKKNDNWSIARLGVRNYLR